MNNPISLHFYSPEERLPEDGSYKIIICEDGEFDFGFYDSEYKLWATMNEFIPMDNVIAWASFSPEWVIGGNNNETINT